jgi:hypothetical protein
VFSPLLEGWLRSRRGVFSFSEGCLQSNQDTLLIKEKTHPLVPSHRGEMSRPEIG